MTQRLFGWHPLRVAHAAPARPAWTIPAETQDRIDRAVAVYGVLVTSVEATFIRDLMGATGQKGTLLEALFWAPVMLWSSRYLGAALRGAALPWTLLMAWLALSTAWSTQTVEAGAKALSLATTVSWCALLLGRPALLRTVMHAAVAVATVSLLARPLGVTVVLPSVFYPAMIALFTHMHLLESSPPKGDAVAAVARAALYAAMVATVALSTFRAPTISTVLGFLWCSRHNRAALVTAAALAVIVAAWFATAAPREHHYQDRIERSDIRGRFETMDEDRLSGRQDIWENVIDDVSTMPSWLVYGTGIGDCDRYVGWLNRATAQVDREGHLSTSSHNTLLEVLISTGLPGALLMAWIVVDNARRLRTDARAAVALTVFVGCMSGVPIYDRSGGGTLLVAVFVALLAAPTRADRRAALTPQR